MGFLMGGAGSVDVRDLIDLAIQGKVQLLMSVVNWGEVYYSTWRYRGVARMRVVYSQNDVNMIIKQARDH